METGWRQGQDGGMCDRDGDKMDENKDDEVSRDQDVVTTTGIGMGTRDGTGNRKGDKGGDEDGDRDGDKGEGKAGDQGGDRDRGGGAAVPVPLGARSGFTPAAWGC